jgi:hypothetical protein
MDASRKKETGSAKEHLAKDSRKRNEAQKLTWGELETSAQDREKWRRLVLALCAPGHSKD